MKKKAIVLSLLFLCVFGLAGCRSGDKENGTKGAETTKAESQVKELSMDTLVADLEDAILSGESQLTCVYKGKAEDLNQKVTEELPEQMDNSYLCKNLLDHVDTTWGWKNGKGCLRTDLSGRCGASGRSGRQPGASAGDSDPGLGRTRR